MFVEYCCGCLEIVVVVGFYVVVVVIECEVECGLIEYFVGGVVVGIVIVGDFYV